MLDAPIDVVFLTTHLLHVDEGDVNLAEIYTYSNNSKAAEAASGAHEGGDGHSKSKSDVKMWTDSPLSAKT